MQQQSMLHHYLMCSQSCLLEGQSTLALVTAKQALAEANKWHGPKTRAAVLRVIDYLRLVAKRGQQ